MKLADAIMNCGTCGDFSEIFKDNEVYVEIDTWWGEDSVTVNGYEGAVTTDFVAQQMISKFSCTKNEKTAAIELADVIDEKIFNSLKKRIRKLEKDNCMSTLVYRIRSLHRMGYSPSNINLTGGDYLLQHSACTVLLF